MTKQPEELALLAESGRLLASVFGLLDRTSLAGMSTLQIDEMVERFIVHDLQARPASKGQYGYGFVLNSSVNDVVCHGVPSQSTCFETATSSISTSRSRRTAISRIPAKPISLAR
jgi:methionyl aminopeptidase